MVWTIPPLVRGVLRVVPALALVLLGYATKEFDTVLASTWRIRTRSTRRVRLRVSRFCGRC